ncbi:MAG: sulfotransferase [Alteromonadaceae bacterium]|nr:sulfotransferase [Alteromonadaceae bacterium]
MNELKAKISTLLIKLEQAVQLHQAKKVELLAKQILQKNMATLAAYHALFQLYEVQQNYNELLKIAKQCLKLFQQDALSYYKLALAQRFLHQESAALLNLVQALSLAPEQIQWRNLYGVMLKENGQLKQAQQCFSECITQQADFILSYYNRASLSALLNASDLAYLQTQFNNDNLSVSDKIYCGYTLFKHFEQQQQYIQAFSYLSCASQLKRQQLHYDHQQEVIEHQQIEDVFSTEFIYRIAADNLATPQKANYSCSAIFICGLPRSGTTLVEQIVSSHSQVTAGDELYALAQATQNVLQQCQPKQAFPFCMQELTIQNFTDIEVNYLHLTRHFQYNAFQSTDPQDKHLQKQRYFTDKMLLNYKAIGVISLAMPTAKIVICQRNAMDVLFGCYKQMLGEGNKYSYDLDELSDIIIAHQQLVQHWQRLFPNNVFLLNYESLIHQQERITRQVLTFLDLPFEQACIDFHQNKRVVHTLSNVQVRQPLFTRGIDQWKNYQTALEPFYQKFKQAGLL